MKFLNILKITFTYFNLDCFVISFKRKESPMKKKIVNTESDLVVKCSKTKQLLGFLAQSVFREKILKENNVSVST